MVGQPRAVDDVATEVFDAHDADETADLEVFLVDRRLLDLTTFDAWIDHLAGRLRRRRRRFTPAEIEQVPGCRTAGQAGQGKH